MKSEYISVIWMVGFIIFTLVIFLTVPTIINYKTKRKNK